MFAKVFLVVLALGVAQASIAPVHNAFNKVLKNQQVLDAAINADMSEWVDQILANVRIVMKEQGLDTIALPESHIEFSKKILGITWHGEASIYDGTLKGLETMHRTGVADLSTDENGDMIITVDAGVNSGSLGATMLAKFMDLGPTATITGTLKTVRVSLVIRVSISSSGIVAQLDKFNIKQLGTLTIDVKGLGFILNFLVEIVADVLGNLIKGVVGQILEGPIKSIINNLLKNPPPIPDQTLAILNLARQHVIPQVVPRMQVARYLRRA